MNKTIIFSDGASRGNPGRGGWGFIVSQNGFVKEGGGKEDNTTNNRMEITAVIEALKITEEENIFIYTDSSYLVSAMTGWIFGWQKNGWKKKVGQNGKSEDVLNRDLFEKLLNLSKDKKIKWIKVSGHSGLGANERCDEIATSFALNKDINLFSGNVEDYKIDLEYKESDKNLNNRKKLKAYSYVSFIDGKIFIDKTWDECKKRVNGIKGVKYKKSLNREDEEKIIKEFEKV